MKWCALLTLSLSVGLVRAGDWPQFLGPDRNGTSAEAIAGQWDSARPRVIWKKAVGEGFAGPVVEGNTVYLFYRRGGVEVLEAFDRLTGASQWQNKEKTDYRDDFGFDPGPRAVPAISGDKIFAMGAEGLVRCVDKSGKTLWTVAAKDQFGARKGFFGMACSPLVVGDRVILNIGGEGAGIVALDAVTGKLRWKCRSDEASYSSPVMAPLAGKPELVAFTREGVCVVEPETGRQLADFHWRSRMEASVNAATPLVFKDHIFLTASYGTGAVLLNWQSGVLQKRWSNDESLSAHYATPVCRDGYLYGFHGRQEYGPSFRCVDFNTGRVAWSQESFGAGTVTLVGDQLLILKESGELVLAAASSAKFAVKGTGQILGSGVRAYPAISEKVLFGRDKGSLAAVALP